MIRVRYRIRFSKTGLLRWTSHLDLVRLWERLLRRISLPLSMTEGFHPKPRMSFANALALGVAGENEVLEVELSEDLPAEEVARRLRDDAQPGLEILAVTRMPEGAPKAQMARSVYQLRIPEDRVPAAQQALSAFRAQSQLAVERKGKSLAFDLAQEIAALYLDADVLCIALNASSQAALRPTDVVAALQLADVLENGEPLTRIRVELENNEKDD